MDRNEVKKEFYEELEKVDEMLRDKSEGVTGAIIKSPSVTELKASELDYSGIRSMYLKAAVLPEMGGQFRYAYFETSRGHFQGRLFIKVDEEFSCDYISVDYLLLGQFANNNYKIPKQGGQLRDSLNEFCTNFVQQLNGVLGVHRRVDWLDVLKLLWKYTMHVPVYKMVGAKSRIDLIVDEIVDYCNLTPVNMYRYKESGYLLFSTEEMKEMAEDLGITWYRLVKTLDEYGLLGLKNSGSASKQKKYRIGHDSKNFYVIKKSVTEINEDAGTVERLDKAPSGNFLHPEVFSNEKPPKNSWINTEPIF